MLLHEVVQFTRLCSRQFCQASSGPASSTEASSGQASSGQASSGQASSAEASINALADALELAAREDEPSVTAVLQELAQNGSGELVGLEHRLKKRTSIIRKIRLQVGEGDASDVVISDALRYTMRIEDAPKGNHVKTIVRVIAALEAKGHRILKLKNYWPKGDNYSGVNSVLVAPSGLQWELQFHTADSLRTQKATRDAYEELRQATTSVERKRELFDTMSSSWDEVQVPADVLDPKSLHETEQIIQHPRP